MFLSGITLMVACLYARAGSMWDSSCSAVMVWVLPLDSIVCFQVLFCFRMVWYGLPSLDVMIMVHSSFLMVHSLVRWDLCRLDCVENADHLGRRAHLFDCPSLMPRVFLYFS